MEHQSPKWIEGFKVSNPLFGVLSATRHAVSFASTVCTGCIFEFLTVMSHLLVLKSVCDRKLSDTTPFTREGRTSIARVADVLIRRITTETSYFTKPKMIGRYCYSAYSVACLFWAAASSVLGQEVGLPETSGPYVSGVHDFEFSRPMQDDDIAVGDYPRRIMARIWYPACAKADVVITVNAESNVTTATCGLVDLGRRRPYSVGNEFTIHTGVPLGFNAWIDALTSAELQSYLDAPPLSVDDDVPPLVIGDDAPPITMEQEDNATSSFLWPLVIHSHSAGGWVSQDQSLILEEIASQGIVVVAMAHPGGAAGIVYPDGDVLPINKTFRESLLEDLSILERPFTSSDIAVRYEAIKEWFELGRGTTPYTSQWSNDQRALLDYLTALKEKDEDNNTTSLIARIVPDIDFDNVAAMGASLGTSPSTASAVRDDRVDCVIGWDWWGSTETLGQDIGVPLLLFTSIFTARGDVTDFFFEDLDTIGSNPNVRRLFIPNATHLDFSDFVFAPPNIRALLGDFPVGSGTIDGDLFYRIIQAEILRFLSDCIGGIPNATLRGLQDPPPGAAVESDVTYVAEWWANYTPPTEEPTSAPTSSPATSAPTSSPTVTTSGPTADPTVEPSMMSSADTRDLTFCSAFGGGVVVVISIMISMW